MDRFFRPSPTFLDSEIVFFPAPKPVNHAICTQYRCDEALEGFVATVFLLQDCFRVVSNSMSMEK